MTRWTSRWSALAPSMVAASSSRSTAAWIRKSCRKQLLPSPRLRLHVYPGQGVQSQGMTLDERASSPAARDVWERADKHTREALDFSILAIVRDNPQVLTANGVTYRHPEGVLNLTQFTQVALATVARSPRLSVCAKQALWWRAHTLPDTRWVITTRCPPTARSSRLRRSSRSSSIAVRRCTTSSRAMRKASRTTRWGVASEPVRGR